MNNHRISFIAIFIFMSFSFLVPVSGQTNDLSVNSIGLSASIGISPALDFDHNQSISVLIEDDHVFAINTPSFEGQFTYYHLFTPRIKLGVGILGGVHSYSLQLYTFEEIQNFRRSMTYINHTKYKFQYGGLSFNGFYMIPIGKKGHLELMGGIQAVYFAATDLGFTESIPYKDPLYQAEFKTYYFSNPENKTFINPRLGIGYTYRIGQMISIGLRLSKTTSSNKYTLAEGEYQLFGDNETLSGTYKKRFFQMGAGVEVMYHF